VTVGYNPTLAAAPEVVAAGLRLVRVVLISLEGVGDALVAARGQQALHVLVGVVQQVGEVLLQRQALARDVAAELRALLQDVLDRLRVLRVQRRVHRQRHGPCQFVLMAFQRLHPRHQPFVRIGHVFQALVDGVDVVRLQQRRKQPLELADQRVQLAAEAVALGADLG
jgi:hypothetical protein